MKTLQEAHGEREQVVVVLGLATTKHTTESDLGGSEYLVDFRAVLHVACAPGDCNRKVISRALFRARRSTPEDAPQGWRSTKRQPPSTRWACFEPGIISVHDVGSSELDASRSCAKAAALPVLHVFPLPPQPCRPVAKRRQRPPEGLSLASPAAASRSCSFAGGCWHLYGSRLVSRRHASAAGMRLPWALPLRPSHRSPLGCFSMLTHATPRSVDACSVERGSAKMALDGIWRCMPLRRREIAVPDRGRMTRCAGPIQCTL
ncbi:hypothetical protein MRX96_008914 [Rhipicephalus microplus]